MSLAAKMRRAPTRLVTGAYILQSGLGRFSADDETHGAVHGMAANAYPQLGNMQPKQFGRALAIGETALGAALLLPIVPTAVAGAGLMGFSGALLGMYWKTPALHRENDPRPTNQGISIAKDSWMFGIGTSLVLDSLVPEGTGRAVRRAERKAAKAEAKVEDAERKGERSGRRAQLQTDAKAAAKAQGKTKKASLKAQAKAAKAARAAAQQAAKRASTATKSAADTVRANVEKGATVASKTAANAANAARSAMDNAGSAARGASRAGS
jgi:uncharacterized membrane protein YphA (DoxX/SURF4 family)